MWRYAELLPVIDYQDVTLGEGLTALTRSARVEKEFRLGKTYFKQEFTCPTGSFKDRGASVLVARARELGAKGLVIDSSGNAAVSLSTYSARTQMKCFVFIPSYASMSKLTQSMVAGATVVKVNGTRQQAYEFANKVREKSDLYYCGFQTNCFPTEGMKTIAYEIAEQFDWDSPDWVVFPVGTGSGLLGCYKGFLEMKKLGWIHRIPSLACVQPDGCAPISSAFTKKSSTTPVQHPKSIAEGLLISNPLRGNMVLSALKETNGTAVSVSDGEIEEATRLLIAREGLFVEPSAGTAFAGLRKLTESGDIACDERIVCVLTGSGLKTLNFYQKFVTEPRTVDPNAQFEPTLD